jgi:TP901 family phage tail tape measure protein
MADDALITTLGFDAQQAITTLASMELALQNYTAAMRKSASATRAFNKVSPVFERNLQKLTKHTYSTNRATKRQAKALEEVATTVKETNKSHQALAQQSRKTSQQMILSWQSVIRIFTIQVIHQAISKVTSSLGQAAGQAAKLEINLAEIQTIGGPLRNDFEGLSGNVRELSDAFGIQAGIVSEGIYQTLSNQIGEARQSFTFFASAADFSVASVTSADASVNLLSSTINAFGYNASQATLIGAKLFKTIELGRIRGEEFANTFGRIAVLASRIGIGLDEVLASIATLTISGLKYNEAFTLINNVMLKLIRPTDELKNLFGKLGISTVEAGIQAFGFQGLLDKLAESSGSTATEMGKLFGRVRAVRGALGLTGEAAKKYAKNLEEIRAAKPEDLFEAKKLIFDTNAKQVQIELQKLRNVIVFDFGRRALKTINDVIQAFGGLTNMAYALAAGLGVVGVGFTGIFLAANPAIAAIIGIGAAMASLVATWNEFSKTQQDRIVERLSANKKAVIEINAAEAKAAEMRINTYKGEFAELQRVLVDRLAAIHTVKQTAMQAEELLSSHLNQQLDKRKSAFSNFVKAISQRMKDAKDNIRDAHNDIFSLQRKLSKEVFEQQTRGYDDVRKAQALLRRSTDIAREGAREFSKGNEERAKTLYSESLALAEQAKSIGQRVSNTSLEARAHQTIKDILNDQISGQQRLIELEKQRASTLGKQLPQEQARGRRIGALIEKAKEFALFTEEGIISFDTEADAIAAIMPLLDAIQKEFNAAGSKINIFKRLEETGENDLQSALKAVLKPLDDIFSTRKLDLKFAYHDRIRTIFKDIQDVANEIPIDVKLRLEKLGFDPSTLKGIEDASKGLVEVFQSIERSIRASSSLKGKQQILKTQVDAVAESANEVTAQFSTQLGIIGTFTEAFKRPIELAKRVATLDATIHKSTDESNRLLGDQAAVYKRINDAAVKAKETITGTFDSKVFGEAIRELKIGASELGGENRQEEIKAVELLIERLLEAAETSQEIGLIEGGTQVQFGTKELEQMENILTKQSELGTAAVDSLTSIGTAAVTSTTTSISAFGAMQEGLKSLQMQAGETAKAIGNIAGGAAAQARFGKMIYRQYGGYTPQSTDTIPAMLSRGEFVVNARSAQKFHSQLIAMNAGNTPTFRRSGGSTTTIGDVNVTVNAATSPQQTARETVRAIRREQRRNTS